jgi:hypothetical protein
LSVETLCPRAAEQQVGLADEAQHPVVLAAADHRSDLGRRIGGVADAQPPGAVDELGDEVLGDALFDQDARSGEALPLFE